ncbi:MAG: hypothetical protein JEY91_06230 [Spirochaetaceae bacterium]|nr:hypothetical protein [Spirochaetaceae bacterium]
MKYKLIMVFILITLPFNIFGDSKKALFLYDMFDDESELYINMIRQSFDLINLPYDEVALEVGDVPDFSLYDRVFIYGKVMAFNLKSPIRDWLKTRPSLKGPDIYLLLTANRWFIDKYTRQISELTKENGGIVVDAVSSATKDLSDEEKRGLVSSLFSGFQ